MGRRIAIVEDEQAIRANYSEAFRRQGYDVADYPNRPAAMTAFRDRLPDLAIIDIGLEDEPEGGFTLCGELRALSTRLPIIFLTARDSDFDIVSGLRLGADDYLTKDVSLPHLLARVAALFRRVEALAGDSLPQEDILQRGRLIMDVNRLTTLWCEQPVDLTLTEFWMVHTLAKMPGHVKNRDQLMQDARLVDDSTITSHIKRIRRKFAQTDPGFDAIDSVYGMGYRWRPAESSADGTL